MPPTYYAIFTTTGLARLATAQATGVPLVFTHVAVGDGNGSPVTPSSSMTALVHEVARVTVNDVQVVDDEPTTVRVEGLIPAATGGFTIREAGLFNGAGELIAIANYPPIYKPTPADGATAEEYIRILLVYEAVTAIALTVDPAVIMATRDYVDAADNALSGRVGYLEDLESAALAYEQFGDGSDGDAVLDGINTYPWATLSGSTYTLLRDVYLHDLTISAGIDLLTGSDAGMTNTGSWRLRVNGTATVPATASINNDGTNSRSIGSLFGSGTGGAGASGSPNNGGVSDTVAEIIAGGGDGGNSSGHSGGAAQNVTARGAKGGVRSLLPMLYGYTLGQDSSTPGVFQIAGGGGGGGGACESGGTGGDGGNGGGVLCAAIRNLVLGGRISVNGSNGTAAATSGGGGGGGAGGYLGLLVASKSGSGTIEARKGTGGAGAGAGGVAGADGSDGVVAFTNLSDGITAPTVPHVEEGKAIFSAVDTVVVTFPNAWAYANASGLNGYKLKTHPPYITDDVYDGVDIWITDKTLTGFTIRASAPFTGEIDWRTEGF